MSALVLGIGALSELVSVKKELGLSQHAIALHLGGCTLVEKWRDRRLVGQSSRLSSVSLVPVHEVTRWIFNGESQVAHLYVDPTSNTHDGKAAVLRDFYAERDYALALLIPRSIPSGDAPDVLERN